MSTSSKGKRSGGGAKGKCRHRFVARIQGRNFSRIPKGGTVARLSQENGQGVAAGVDMLDRYLYQIFGFQVDAAGLR
jgi:hypothetical protein